MYSLKYTYPFLLGYTLAFFIKPLVQTLQVRLKIPKSFAILLAMILTFGILFGVLTIIVIEAISGIDTLSNQLPHYLQEWASASIAFFNDTILPRADRVTSYFNSFNEVNQQALTVAIRNINSDITNWLVQFLKSLVTNIPKLLEWIPSTAIGMIFTGLSTYFISKQWENLSSLFQTKLPDKVYTPIDKVVTDLKRATIGFFGAQLILLAISAVIASIGFMILGLSYPITFGILVGMGELIPYIGISSIFLPWIFFAFITGERHMGLGLLLIFIIVVTIRVLIEPKVISKSVGISPLSTLVVMFIGYTLHGIPGILLGILILVFLTTLHRNGTFRDLWHFIINDRDNVTNRDHF